MKRGRLAAPSSIATSLMIVSAVTVLLLASCRADSAADAGADYGPDWPICRNLNLEPQIRIEAAHA
jgi:hypothetical protein